MPLSHGKGLSAMDDKIVEMIESLDEEQLNLFLAYLQDISCSQSGLECSDR